VDVRLYDVIYKLTDDLGAALQGMLAPKLVEQIEGHAEVRMLIKAGKAGQVGGSYVLDGRILRGGQARLMRGGQLVAESRIESVPTGIDAGRFRPGERKASRARFGLPEDKTLVGIVATLRSWKGHAVLLEAMTRLPSGIELVIVGDGPQREALEQKIAKLGLRGRVRMQGQQADVLPWLRALDIFALPSFANEGVPQALVQAMLTELPCVTTPVGGIPEVAEHDRTALLVPPRDVSALAAAIERLAGDAGLRRELGEAARKHCVEGYSYERMLDRMEAVYRKAAGG